MTREEAIKNLEIVLDSAENRCARNIVIPELEEALKIAIEALKVPKQGEWVEVTHSGKDIYLCSECAEAYKMYITYNFCPNCGARMKEGDEK